MRLLLLFCLAVGLGACNMNAESLPTPNADNQIVITATPELPTPNADGVIFITATPDGSAPVTTTPAPTLTPTPFEQPIGAMQEAQTLLRNGYFEQATRTYADILAQGDLLAPDIRAEAAFRLAQAALQEGLYREALNALNVLIGVFPNDARVPQAYFLRGDAHLGLSEWQNAIADFRQYLALRPNLIDSYAHERIGDAHIALGQVNEALASYEAAASASRSLVPQLALREKVAQVLLTYGRVQEAIAQYDAILAVARNPNYRASMELQAGLALLRGGETAAALARLQAVFDNYRDTPSAFTAMTTLVQNGVTIDPLARGRVAFAQKDYVQAIDAFNAFTSSATLESIPADMYLSLGRAYREIGNSAAAVVAFQTVIDRYPNDPSFGAALLEQGRTRFLAGDIPAAISTYLSIADRYGYLEATASEAMWRAGYLYGTNNDPVKSRETFVVLANKYPNSEWASNGLLLAASAAVNSGEIAIAENLYGRIATLSTGVNRAAAYLWVGRLARERGDIRASDEALALARATAPESYFGVRANDILNGAEPFAPPAGVRFTFDDNADRAIAEAWVRATFNVPADVNLSQLTPTLSTDTRLLRGLELWQVAAYNEALAEFNGILEEARTNKDGATSYQLAVLLKDLGAYYSSIVAAADVIVASGVATLDAPAFIARMRYPVYYADLVQAQAQRYGFDPLILFALMRQESLYNTNAVSSAGASGLTQVMPATGQYIATKINVPNFTSGDLFRPYMGIAMGAFYIDEQLRLFKGNVAAALAAYNAGPGRALDWVRLSGGSLDALMLTIQFQETRTYLERITSHYAIYRALYGVP